MPFRRQIKREVIVGLQDQNNDTMKQNSGAKKRLGVQNDERLHRTLRKIKIFLGQLFYELGTEAEYTAVRFGRNVARAARFVGRNLARQGHAVAAAAASVWRTICEDVTEPVHRIKSGMTNIRSVVAEEKKENGSGHAVRRGTAYFVGGIKRYGYLGKNLLAYLLPLAAGAVFVVTVSTVLGRNYALAVRYEDNLVGYVKDSSVYTDAEKMVEGRIVYTADDESGWSVSPTFAVVAARKDEISDTETLADAILEASGAEITEAVGLYVDGTFYGATTDSLQLENDLEQIKKPYEESYPDAEIGFVQNVQLTSGIYLTSSVVDYSQLSGLLTSEVQGQRTYLIEKGDTPIIIAGKNGVTLSDLYAMNPVLENGAKVPVGQELLIAAPQSFLQVKAVRTVVEDEEISYTTNKTNDDSMSYGQTKVTQKGVKGVDSVTYSCTFVDGVQVAKTEVARTTVSAPVTEEISVGTKTPTGATFTPGSGGMLFPVAASGYKGMSRGFTGVNAHNGLDLRGYVGTPIYAAQSGVVTTATYGSTGYGIHVVINHGGGISTLYGHCSALAVSAGQYVTQGQVIAYLGSSGNSTGPHCHFEVIVNGVRVNPMGYLG